MKVYFVGGDITNLRKEDAGKALADRLREILTELKVPDGLSALGYNNDVIPAMVDGAMPQVANMFLK